MSFLALLERPAVTRQRRVFPSTDPLDPDVRLTLRTELFLIAHDDQTGRQHLDQRVLSLGLAAAVLLELWLDNRILISRTYQIRDGIYIPDPGRITITDPTLYGDPLTDAAITLLKRTGGPLYVSDFIRQFATLDLYHRVRGDMIATAVLHRTTHRRLGLFKKEKYLPVKTAWAVQARSKLRNLATPRSRTDPLTDFPDTQTVALAGLVTALGLTRHLYHPEPATLHGQLMDIIGRLYDTTIRDVAAAINPSGGHRIRRQ